MKDFFQIFTYYILPSISIILILSFIAGVFKNKNLIEDKNNEGAKQKGWGNVRLFVTYVFAACTIIVLILSILYFLRDNLKL